MTQRAAALAVLLFSFLLVPHAQEQPMLEAVLTGLSFRNIGPFRTAAWVTEVAVSETPARDHLQPIG